MSPRNAAAATYGRVVSFAALQHAQAVRRVLALVRGGDVERARLDAAELRAPRGTVRGLVDDALAAWGAPAMTWGGAT